MDGLHGWRILRFRAVPDNGVMHGGSCLYSRLQKSGLKGLNGFSVADTALREHVNRVALLEGLRNLLIDASNIPAPLAVHEDDVDTPGHEADKRPLRHIVASHKRPPDCGAYDDGVDRTEMIADREAGRLWRLAAHGQADSPHAQRNTSPETEYRASQAQVRLDKPRFRKETQKNQQAEHARGPGRQQ